MRGFSFEKPAPPALPAASPNTTALGTTAVTGGGSSSSSLLGSVPRPLPLSEGGGSGVVVEGGGGEDLGLFHLFFGRPRLEGASWERGTGCIRVLPQGAKPAWPQGACVLSYLSTSQTLHTYTL